MSERAAILIHGGTIVDGTGAPGVHADVAVVGDRLVDASEAPSDATVLDASGCVVAPGFIDIHTHYDAQVFWDPALSPSCYHGVTTVVAGNCGFSIAPTRPEHRDAVLRTLENVEDMSFATLSAGLQWDFETFGEYLRSVERAGPVLNFGAFVGHTPLRLFVMGFDAYERAATADEIAEMRRVLAESLRAGALGFATSSAATHLGMNGRPIPSRFAESAEVVALMEEVAAWGRGVIEVTASDPRVANELYSMQPRLGVPITYGAILADPAHRWRERLDVHRRGIEAGADVWPQVTPRPLTFAFRMDDPFPLNSCPAFGELMTLTSAERAARYRDPRWREQARRAVDEMQIMRPRFDTYRIAGTGDEPVPDGTPLTTIAAQRGVAALDALLDLAAEDPSVWVRAIALNDDPDDVAVLLQAEHCALGLSDAGAHVGQLCDAAQATELLGHWVRERGVLPIEEAVRRLTSAQADLFGLGDRGRLQPGLAADVVVFDPDTVAPGPVTSARDFPADGIRLTAPTPTGVRHVLVNGAPIRIDERQMEPSGFRPGRVVAPVAPPVDAR
jgi:N-acyl-D-aspartate/D-glutamate deacylase